MSASRPVSVSARVLRSKGKGSEAVLEIADQSWVVSDHFGGERLEVGANLDVSLQVGLHAGDESWADVFTANMTGRTADAEDFFFIAADAARLVGNRDEGAVGKQADVDAAAGTCGFAIEARHRASLPGP